MKKILVLYRDLQPAEQKAVRAAMDAFSGEPAKEKRNVKTKTTATAAQQEKL